MPSYDELKAERDVRYGDRPTTPISMQSPDYINTFVSHGGLNNSPSNPTSVQDSSYDPTSGYGYSASNVPSNISGGMKFVMTLISIIVGGVVGIAVLFYSREIFYAVIAALLSASIIEVTFMYKMTK